MKTINFRVELLPFLNRDLNTAYAMSDIKLPWYNRTFQCFICSVLWVTIQIVRSLSNTLGLRVSLEVLFAQGSICMCMIF